MSLLALLLLAVLYLAFAFVDWRGVRNTLQKPAQGIMAAICMYILGRAAWDNLALLGFAVEAYSLGVEGDLQIPFNLFQLAAVAITAVYAPRWLVEKA